MISNGALRNFSLDATDRSVASQVNPSFRTQKGDR